MLSEIKPGAWLTEYIRLYRIIDFRFPGSADIPPKLYSPRPEHCLQFYPRDTETVTYPGKPDIISNQKVTVTGQHDILSSRIVGHNFLSFQVLFQPGAFYRLSNVSMHELNNAYLNAEYLFGTSVRDVNEQLAAATSYTDMLVIVEHFLTALVRRTSKQEHRVDAAGKQMLLLDEHFNVDRFLKESCLCHRQFDRKFKERVGIAPKQFLQIIRFDKAFRLKNKHPQLDWLSIAVQCGYHDYQHLARDYKWFTGYTPPQFFAIDNQAPERAFGYAEV